MSDFPAGQIRINLTISGTIEFVPTESNPSKPIVQSVSFTREGSDMVGTVSLSELIASDHVSSRLVVVTINGTDLPAIEALDTPAQFTCSDGDAIVIVDTDVNAAGSTASDPFSTTATLPLAPPAKPSVLGVTFSA